MSQTMDNIGRWLAIALFCLGCFFILKSHKVFGENYIENLYKATVSSRPPPMMSRVGAKPRPKIEEVPFKPEIPTIEECVEEIEYHQKEARFFYDMAQQRCWFLPDMTNRKTARYCFEIVTPLIFNAPISIKVVGIVYGAFIKYGLDCMDEWDEIEILLIKSQHHIELAEFYELILVIEAH